MCRRNERSLIWANCQFVNMCKLKNENTSSSNRSLLVRYFGLKAFARSSSPWPRFRLVPLLLSSAVLVGRPMVSPCTFINIAMVASSPVLNSAKVAASKSLLGWLKFCCNAQNIGYSSSALNTSSAFENATLFEALLVSSPVFLEVPFIDFFVSLGSESTSISSGATSLAGRASNVVTFST